MDFRSAAHGLASEEKRRPGRDGPASGREEPASGSFLVEGPASGRGDGGRDARREGAAVLKLPKCTLVACAGNSARTEGETWRGEVGSEGTHLEGWVYGLGFGLPVGGGDRIHPSGKFSQERLTRGIVASTMSRAAHPSGCASRGAGAGCSAIKYQSLFGLPWWLVERREASVV